MSAQIVVTTWHDEAERWERTGQLDQGPCWCTDCLTDEIEATETTL